MKLENSFSEQEIIEQLNRILSFPTFTNSMILSGFLQFIVKETIADREQSLKEYTIGTHVLAKKTGYNPQDDASVRIHAGRLRKALSEYYEGHGINDSILITIPKGGYIPNFELQVSKDNDKLNPPQTIIYKPTLAILPFHCMEEKNLQILADGLCDQICTELAYFNELAIISYFSSRKISFNGTNLKEAGHLLDAGYLLTGSIQSFKDNIRIRVQLIQSNTQHQVWACTYEMSNSALDNFTIQDDIVKHVINQIGGSHGIIFRKEAKASPIKHALDIRVYDAVFWYYYLVNDLNEGTFAKGLKAMQSTVHLDPQYALGWAILGESYVAGYFFGYNCSLDNPIEEGIKCGQKALKIDPYCQHAYQTLALAYLFQHKAKDCIQIVQDWKKLKSNAAGIAGGLGFCLICAGEYNQGYQMLSESIQLNPYYQWWFNAGLSIYHFQNNDFEDAIYWAEKVQKQSAIWESLLKAAAFSELKQNDLARVSLLELKEIIPNLSNSLEPILRTFLLAEELINRYLVAIRNITL